MMSGQEFTHSMPKVELHAHLSGSLSCKSVEELIQLHKKTFPDEELPPEADRFKDITEENCSFDTTYAIFRVAQSIVDHPEAVAVATTRVIEDFADDNVKFLELRSTPRAVTGKMTKEEYVESIVDAIEKCSTKLSIMVKYLVSIDRRGSLEDAETALQLCIDMNDKHPHVVVGLDLSGDARVNDARDLMPVLRAASDAGLSVTVHLAEVPNKDEVLAFLTSDWRPDRLGHATCIHPDFGGDKVIWETFTSLKPPLPTEICLTSNLICKSTADDIHHVQRLHESGLPFIICTDDKGVFGCTLSSEYSRAAKVLQLSNKELFQLSENSIQFAFATSEEKEELKKMWIEWKELNIVQK